MIIPSDDTIAERHNEIKELPPQGFLKECFDYDPETGILLWKRRPLEHFRDFAVHNRWNTRWAGEEVGRTKARGYMQTTVFWEGKPKNFYLHRLIWVLVNGNIPDGLFVDHKDRNPSNNRLSNLRLAEQHENMKNSKRLGTCPLPRGVRITTHNSFVAYYVHKKVYVHVGTFYSVEKAKAARDAAIAKVVGEFTSY